MTSLQVLMASLDGMAPVALNDQNIYVAPHFNHLDLKTGEVPLSILAALHDVDNGGNAVP